MTEPVSLALDTSVIVRLLTQEPQALFQTAAQFLEARLTAGVPVFISDLVLAEAYFALQTCYHFPKADALRTIAALAQTNGLSVSPLSLGRPFASQPGHRQARFRRPPHPFSKPDGRTYPRHLRKSRQKATRHLGALISQLQCPLLSEVLFLPVRQGRPFVCG